MNNGIWSSLFNFTAVSICSRTVRCLGLGRIIAGQLKANLNPFVLRERWRQLNAVSFVKPDLPKHTTKLPGF